jgi:hypothetical protein
MFSKKTNTIVFSLIAILALLSLIGGCTDKKPTVTTQYTPTSTTLGPILPGQSENSSLIMADAIDEIEKLTGRTVIFLDITTRPNYVTLRDQGVDGDISVENSIIHIWLEPSLPPSVIENIAAHEFGHANQFVEDWCKIGTPVNANGEPISQEITLIGNKITNMIQDANADYWATNHGFSMEEFFKSYELPILLNQDLDALKTNGQEASNWDNLHYHLRLFAENVRIIANSNNPPSIQDKELNTIAHALFFAKIKLEYASYDSFSEVEKLYKLKLPIARKMGLKIADIVKDTGYNTKEQNDKALVRVLEYLDLPSELFKIINP